MPKSPRILWLDDPEDKDYTAAEHYVSMLVPPARLPGVIAQLHSAPSGRWAAKDVLRAASLPPMKPKTSSEVSNELEKIKRKTPISPILTIGGLGASLVIADGYHRASAAYRVHEASMVPGRLLWLT